jgi:hypothetical protein
MLEQPQDPEKRDTVLNQANSTAGPEHRKGFTPKMRKVETAAATAAAVIGQMFSSTQNVFIGTATTIDENELFEPVAVAPEPESAADADKKKRETGPLIPEDTTELVPWVKLKPAPAAPAAP